MVLVIFAFHGLNLSTPQIPSSTRLRLIIYCYLYIIQNSRAAEGMTISLIHIHAPMLPHSNVNFA